MIEKKLLNEINNAYSILEAKQYEILNRLKNGCEIELGWYNDGYEVELAWYNGNYHKDEKGEWIREAYPIAVLAVKGLCDVEIYFDKISVSAKLTRARALEYSYEKIFSYNVEVFGVEDYLLDFYKSGMFEENLKANIAHSDEEEIGFAFEFSFDAEVGEIAELVGLIKQEGFYY